LSNVISAEKTIPVIPNKQIKVSSSFRMGETPMADSMLSRSSRQGNMSFLDRESN
jgi:hypothetical protein